MNPETIKPPRHCPTPAAKCADLVVHIVGLTLGLVGGIVLLTLAVQAGQISKVVGVSIYALGVLGWDVKPLLAGAGVLGVALGFGAQTLVRDVIAGVFILIEDQFAVSSA